MVKDHPPCARMGAPGAVADRQSLAIATLLPHLPLLTARTSNANDVTTRSERYSAGASHWEVMPERLVQNLQSTTICVVHRSPPGRMIRPVQVLALYQNQWAFLSIDTCLLTLAPIPHSNHITASWPRKESRACLHPYHRTGAFERVGARRGTVHG